MKANKSIEQTINELIDNIRKELDSQYRMLDRQANGNHITEADFDPSSSKHDFTFINVSNDNIDILNATIKQNLHMLSDDEKVRIKSRLFSEANECIYRKIFEHNQRLSEQAMEYRVIGGAI